MARSESGPDPGPSDRWWLLASIVGMYLICGFCSGPLSLLLIVLWSGGPEFACGFRVRGKRPSVSTSSQSFRRSLASCDACRPPRGKRCASCCLITADPFVAA